LFEALALTSVDRSFEIEALKADFASFEAGRIRGSD
jgi:hypothetical protein